MIEIEDKLNEKNCVFFFQMDRNKKKNRKNSLYLFGWMKNKVKKRMITYKK